MKPFLFGGEVELLNAVTQIELGDVSEESGKSYLFFLTVTQCGLFGLSKGFGPQKAVVGP